MPERADLERRATELLQRLIRLNSVNPPGNEHAVQELLRDLLEGAGFECELLAAVPGRPNLVASMGGRSDGPVLCLLGHVDTVLADPGEWSVDPWSGELRDGCVWGRGAIDMKSQVAAEAASAIALVEAGWRPESGELKLVFTCDEETGALHGARWLCAQHPGRVRADLVVNEGAGALTTFRGTRAYGVCVAEKGIFRFTVVASGAAAHASVPRLGENALVKLAPVLEALGRTRPDPIRSPEADAFLSTFGFDPDDPAGALAAIEAEDPRLAVVVEPILGVTFTPTMASASEKVNVIPARARVEVDCRVPPELGEQAVWDALDGTLPDGFEVDLPEHVVGNRSPIETPLMDTIRAWIAREDPGAVAAPLMMQGFSDSHWWRRAFPDCVAYGFFPMRAMDVLESLPLMHGANERVPVADLGLAASFYADLMQETLA